MEKAQWIDMLKRDVVPALGCTEPVCVALCAAYAAQQFSGDIRTVNVRTNAGIYKNGMSAGIPHCNQVGLPWAAAIGACLNNPSKQLRLLEDLSPEILAAAANLEESGSVSVTMDPGIKELYVSCNIHGTEESVTAIIRDAHTNLVHLEKNGAVLLDGKSVVQNTNTTDEVDILKNMTFACVIKLRKTQPDAQRKYKVPCYPAIPLLAIASGLYVIASQLFMSGMRATVMSLCSIGITLIGLPVYMAVKKKSGA